MHWVFVLIRLGLNGSHKSIMCKHSKHRHSIRFTLATPIRVKLLPIFTSSCLETKRPYEFDQLALA